ncbi:unnamed protein product, partial [marine sediment metagenome]
MQVSNNPTVVIEIMKKIQDHIAEAIRLAKIEPRYIFYLGYPTHNKRNISNYVSGLENIIRILIKEGEAKNIRTLLSNARFYIDYYQG